MTCEELRRCCCGSDYGSDQIRNLLVGRTQIQIRNDLKDRIPIWTRIHLDYIIIAFKDLKVL
jgi:hypothetical protein